MPAPTSTDSNFEQTFSTLAFTRLGDKAPSLMDYLIGFQLLDKNDEETQGVGVFGFKIGKDWVYAPVFYINGELKGYELLYIKSQDTFVPMAEGWVNYILNRRPRILGEDEEKPRSNLAIRQPDFDLFSRAPYIGSKYASKSYSVHQLHDRIKDWARPALDMFMGANLDKFASLSTFTIDGAIRRLGKQAGINLVSSLVKDEKFAESVLKFYDMETIIKAAKEADTYERNTDEVMMKQRKGKVQQPVPKIVMQGGTASGVELDDADRRKLMADSYVVKDPRTQDQRSRLYSTQINATLNSPSKSGFCNVMDSDGKFRKLLVLTHAHNIGWNTDDPKLTYLVDTDAKTEKGKKIPVGGFNNSEVLCANEPDSDEFKKWFDKLPAADDLKLYDIAFLIAPNGGVIAPFEVNRISSDTDGQTEYSISSRCFRADSSFPKARAVSSGEYGRFDTPTKRVESIVCSSKEGTGPTTINSTMFVPKGYKALVVRGGAEERKRRESWDSPSSYDNDASISVGSLNEAIGDMHKAAQEGKGLATIQLMFNNDRFVPILNGQSVAHMSKISALRYLILKHGLDVEDTEFLFKEAQERGRTASYFIKYAFGEPPASAVFPDPQLSEEHGLNTPVMYPQQLSQNLSQNDNASAREEYRDKYVDDTAKTYANSAAELGQKEVLDTSVITGLVKTMDPDTMVDSYVGDMLLALDRIGRILFMFYWHYDKFKERYGQADMADLEDNLRNVFKNLGELTLFLKQKTVDPSRHETSEAGLTDVLS